MLHIVAQRDGSVLVFTMQASTDIVVARYLAKRWPLHVAHAAKEARRAVVSRKKLAAAIIDVEGDDGVGIELLDVIRRCRPAMPVLVLGSAADPTTSNHTQRLGAEFVYMPVAVENLRAFARRVVVSQHLSDERSRCHVTVFAEQHALSVRQAEILALAVADFSRDESATRMGISLNTYKTEVRALLKKTRRDSVAELASELRAAVRRGL